MQLNYEQSKLHCELLTGGQNLPLTFQFFYDVKGQLKKPELAQHFVSTLDDAWARITQAQSSYCGIYIGVNATDGKGRKNENITKYRALFVDFDGQTEPQWFLEPSFVTMRDATHGHAYWLISDDEITNPDTFKQLQKRLSVAYGTDAQVVDPARVLRLCGSVHYKNPVLPAQYNMVRVSARVNTRYSIKEVIDTHLLDAEKDAELNQWINNRNAISEGIGYEESDRYNNQFVKWCSINAPAAVEGQNGDHTLYKVTQWANDHGIPLSTAQAILWEHYNPRCEPPWDDSEQELFNQTIVHAYEYAQSAAGCKTAKSMFTALGQLPPPDEGWESNKKIIEPVIAKGDIVSVNRITCGNSQLLLAQLTVKSGHYDLAQAFDGMVFDGNRIVRHEKQFFKCNGKSWKEVSDDVIKALVQKFYSDYKPPDTFTRGVFNVFCDLVNIEEVKNGMWLSDPNKDGSNVVVFKNGMVDFSGKPPYKLQPHSVDFFNYSEVNYNYDVNAKAPIWDAFCATVWPNHPENKITLEEWMGYCLTNSIDLQKFMILIGLSRAGKGVITRVMINVIGSENVCSPSLQDLTKDSVLHKMSTSKHALINDAHSVSYGIRDSTLSQFKAITGNDMITFHRMYKGAMSLQMPCRMTMSTNGFPEFVDSSGALMNRALVLPFRESFAGREDVELDAKLATEVAGIAQKAINAYVRLRKNKGLFTTSIDSEAEKEELQEDMFPLSQFVNISCELLEGALTSVDELFAAYNYWCTLDGIKTPFTKIQFAKQLKNSSLGLKKIRPYNPDGFKVNSFLGIRIKREITSFLTNTPKFPKVGQ